MLVTAVSPAVFRQMHGIFDELCKLRPHPGLENVSERNFGIYQDSVNGVTVIKYEVYDSDGTRSRNRWYVADDGKLVDWVTWKERELEMK